MIRKNIAVGLILVFFAFGAGFAQREKSDIREGNRLFKTEKFEESEVAYRKALDVQDNSIAGNFNLGDALYRQEKFEEAGKQFSDVSNKNSSREVIAQAYHNLGNSLLQEGKLDESIEAYKDALRRNPSDMETKYNLAYAQNMKKQQEEQDQEQDQNQDQDKDKDKEQDQDKKQDQNQDKQDQQDNQDKDQEQQDQEQKQDDQEQQQDQQQKQEPKISKEDAQRLLDALANDEKKTQEKVKLAKAKAKKVRTLKEW